jgi:hypothetical protein
MSEQPDLKATATATVAFSVGRNVFKKQRYTRDGVDVGSLFHQFQCRSTRLVNKAKEKVTLSNIGSFLYVIEMLVCLCACVLV